MLTELLSVVEFATAVVCHKEDIVQTLSSFPLQFLVKMRINQGYLLVLLLASLSPSYTSDCPTTEFYGQPAYRQCTKLYDIFEAALIENRENLFKLHDNLFPSSSSEPPYAVVKFFFRHGEVQTCWTSSVLLRSVDPIILASLQLRLLNILLQTVGVSELTTTPNSGGYGVQLPIELNVSLTQSDFDHHFNVIYAVLQDLASWVSCLDQLKYTQKLSARTLRIFVLMVVHVDLTKIWGCINI